MGNVNLPTPVAVTGGALCILGGYLLGAIAGPDTPERTTGIVDSYDADTGDLCLTGETIQDQEGATDDGLLCGEWRRTQANDRPPDVGDEFRFVSMVVDSSREAESADPTAITLIYGDVVR